MVQFATQLDEIVTGHLAALRSIPGDEMSYKPSPGKWSKKEIIGHLIDSAQNNIRRFIVAQYEDIPHIIYNQDQWVALSDYQHRDDHELVELWYFLNKQLCAILKHISPSAVLRKCKTEELHTLEWLAMDYIKHLRHHLHQVLGLEPVAYR